MSSHRRVVTATGPTLTYYLDASAQGAFPGASITTSASFNGTTQYLSLTNSAFTQIGSLTVEAWYYPTNVTGGHTLFCLGTEAPDRFIVALDGTSVTSDYFDEGARITYTSNVPINTWTHIAVVRSGSSVRVYINGTASATTYTQFGTMGNGALTIGANANGEAWFAGYISNFRMTNTAVYTGNFVAPTSTLRAVTGTVALLPLTAAPFMDISPNLLTVTNTGTVTTTASAPSLTAATTDVTGNYALSYSNASARITWSTDQGGVFRNTFSGDGINAYITGGPDWSTQRSYTVFMGYKLTGTSNYGRLLNSNTGSPDWLMGGYSSKSKTYYANGVTINLSGPIDVTWHLDWARFNISSGVGDLFSVTTSQPTSTPAYTTTNSGIGAFNQLKLFSKSDGNECAAGDIAFVRVWNGVMTTAQMQAEWTAFHARVGF
jgi:hypothetical protein